MSIHCVIPAKGTSLAIKEKNLQKISGQSLLGISMKYAEFLPNVLNIIISTDSQNVADEICRSISIDSIVLEDIEPDAVKKLKTNFSLHRRLEQHSTSESKTAEFLPSILKQISASSEDLLLLLQPTSPFRSKEDFDSLLLLIEGADSVISAKLFDSPHPEKRIKSDQRGFLIETETNTGRLSTPRQKLEEFLVFDGAFYLTKCSVVFNETKLIGNRTRLYIRSGLGTINIDNEIDLEIARALAESGRIVLPSMN